MPLSRITNPFLGTSGYRSVTDFTATAGQTSFTVPSYAVGYIDVYRNGVKLAAADFTATSGTTVVLANPATLGDVITAISTYMGTATNLSVTGGTINGQLVVNSATGVIPFISQVNSTEVLRIDSSGNVGIGTNINLYGFTKELAINAASGTSGYSYGVTGSLVGLSYCDASNMYIGTYPANPLIFRTNNTERMRIDASGYLTNNVNGNGSGRIQAHQYYRLNSDLAGANATGAQSLFGVGVTLVGSMTYEFEMLVALSKTAGTTSHSFGFGFGGTATLNNIQWQFSGTYAATQTSLGAAAPVCSGYSTSASNLAVNNGTTAATVYWWGFVKGTVSINAGGTFIPQYTLSAAPGGAYTTAAGSYVKIAPIGVSATNNSIGSWA
jgi:hypothetical protein